MQQQLPRGTWYEPQLAAGHHLRLDSARGSTASLLGGDSPAFVSSIPPSIDSPGAPSEDSAHQRLPPPPAHILRDRPSTSSSIASSEASSPPLFGQDPEKSGVDLSAAIPPRQPSTAGRYSPVTTPTRRTRPLSMSSAQTYGSSARTSRIYGVPHAPHNQIQIILPTPLASANNSRESLAMRGRYYGADAFDRRSVADPWISMPGHMSNGHRSAESLSLPQEPGRESRPRRRHASVGVPANVRMQPVVYGAESIPPVPSLERVSESRTAAPKSGKLEKPRMSPT